MLDRELQARDAAYKMLQTCQGVCPTGKEQAGFTNLYNTMLMAGETHVAVIRAMAGALADGLDNGNWPLVPSVKVEGNARK